MLWVIVRDSDGQYYTGVQDNYSPSLKDAKTFTDDEKDICFCYPTEKWKLLSQVGQA